MTHPLPQFARERWQLLDGPWGTVEDERITYRHTFRVPEDWDRTLLCFGAVDWRADVFVDGDHVGSHEGGYTHFRFDLGRLTPGEHELVVDVFDPADDAFGQAKGKQRGSHDIWYTRTTGIWRCVWIESVPDEYIRELSVDEIDDPRLWSPDDPFLYDVELTLGEDGVTSYVGYRTIEARGRELYLNGEPLRIAGVLDQGYWPDTVYTATDAQLRADVEAAKALGFNLVRKHMKVEDPRWYTWCDRLGLLVAQDMPSSHDLSARPEQFKQEWAEIVRQLSGHPSIVIWIPINEDWGEPSPELQRELVDIARGDGRLVVDASGWKQQLGHTDLIDVHDYGARLEKHLEHAAATMPVWFGELGGVSLGDADYTYRDVTDLADAYRDVVEQIPDDVCGFVWTQLADVEGERNGLLTANRVPKADVDAIRAVNERFLLRSVDRLRTIRHAHPVRPTRVYRFYRGGALIDRLRGAPAEDNDYPEDWVGSVVAASNPGRDEPFAGLTRLESGPFLRDAIRERPAYWGTPNLLVKLLDPVERLPVHAHPDRAFALDHLGSDYGKTEAWIFVEARDGESEAWLGLKETVEPEQYREWIERQDTDALLGSLNHLTVKPSDVLYVPAGVPHAIGGGALIVELQEPTDYSIICEWKDFPISPDDAHLGLGWDAALGALDLSAFTPQLGLPPEAAEFFSVDDRAEPGGRFGVLLVLEGNGEIDAQPARAGDAFVLPAGGESFDVHGDLRVLRCLGGTL